MSAVVTKGRMSGPADAEAAKAERAADRIRFLAIHSKRLWNIHVEHGTTFADPVFEPGIPDQWSSTIVEPGSWEQR